VHYSLIKKSLDIKNGTLAYHLNVLEKENILISKMDGVRRRFYPANMKISEEITHLNKTQQDIIEQIRKRPGISQKEISSLIGVSTQVVNYYIKIMAESSIIRLVRDGKVIRCYFVET
jgi:predicted transcriptional regulator